MAKQRILITGGAGFIGSYLTQILIDRFKITIIDSNIFNNTPLQAIGLSNSQELGLMENDIMDTSWRNKLGNDFDIIIHAAGILGVQKVAEYPYQTMIVNGIGTYQALEFALQQKILKRFINFSTSEIYGQLSFDVTEKSKVVLPSFGRRWGYAASKFFGEYLARSAFYEYNLPSVTVRPFNVYGPYRTAENGMRSLVLNALNNEPITIIGSGNQRRSWCHVKDFIQGVIACIDTKDIEGESFNIGNDDNCLAMNELAEKIIKITKSHSKIIHTANYDDVLDRKPNISKARELLNYSPQISVEEGIIDMVKQIKNE